MCIAILIPVGKQAFLTRKLLTNCFDVNSDGIGYAYPDGEGGITIKKFMDFEEFIGEWDTDKEVNTAEPIMLHFRATSMGDTDLDNCHPFVVNEGQAFCHNGTIHKVPIDPSLEASDTRMFNRLFLRNLPIGWERSVPITTMMEHYIGASKLIVLNGDSSAYILNEKAGKWDGGIWFSNEHYNGKWSRTTGAAFRKTYPRTYGNHNMTTGGTAALKLAKQKRIAERKATRAEAMKQIPLHTHPADDIGQSMEALCEFCNKPFNEDELILIDYGQSKMPFNVCHVCANKISF